MIRKFIIILFSLFIFVASSESFAGAAEKWDYEVKPDTNQKLELKGHQVDKYGNPANDYQYKTKIDPKIPENKIKMGTVAISKLLKKANWAITGVELFQTFLEGIDWVIDPAAQSIWRFKPVEYNTPGCVGSGYVFQYQIGNYRNCPIDAVQYTLNEWSKNGASYEFVKWDTYFEGIPDKFTVTLTVGNSVQTMPNQQLNRKKDPKAVPLEKEYLTPETAADYANHTHPDFTDPKYAPRAEPLYKPEMQTELWKPHNDWEYENSPTVDEAIKQLEQASPEPKDDTIKENEPDPDTGAKSFSLPAFCSWATSVCEFIDWFKKEPDLQDQELDIDEQIVNDYQFEQHVSFGASCPFSPQSAVIDFGVGSFSMDYDFTIACDIASDIRSYVIAISHLAALLFLAYAIRNGNG